MRMIHTRPPARSARRATAPPPMLRCSPQKTTNLAPKAHLERHRAVAPSPCGRSPRRHPRAIYRTGPVAPHGAGRTRMSILSTFFRRRPRRIPYAGRTGAPRGGATYRCDAVRADPDAPGAARAAASGCRARAARGPKLALPVTARFGYGYAAFCSRRGAPGGGRDPRARADGPAACLDACPCLCTDMPHKPSNSMPIAHADRVLNPDRGRCTASRLRRAPRATSAPIGPRPRARAVTGLLRLDTAGTLHTTQNYTGRGTT